MASARENWLAYLQGWRDGFEGLNAARLERNDDSTDVKYREGWNAGCARWFTSRENYLSSQTRRGI